jgi:hypothetical protein
MKTAMQELIEWCNEYQGQMISADQVVLKAYKLLVKEKEQIIEAFLECWKANMPDGFECKLNSKDYYNQTYNQKQIIIDIMKADEEDGLYNQNK